MRSVEKALSGQWESPPPRPRYDCLLLGVTFPRDVVCRRIDERLQARLDAGMVEEVAALRAGGADDSFWSTAISSGTSRGKSPPWTR